MTTFDERVKDRIDDMGGRINEIVHEHHISVVEAGISLILKELAVLQEKIDMDRR